MDVFVMVKRQKSSLFLDAKESTELSDLKKTIGDVYHVAPEDMRLYKDDRALLDDTMSLGEYGFTSTTAAVQKPNTIGLVFRQDDGEWEPLSIDALTEIPENQPLDLSAPNNPEQPAS